MRRRAPFSPQQREYGHGTAARDAIGDSEAFFQLVIIHRVVKVTVDTIYLKGSPSSNWRLSGGVFAIHSTLRPQSIMIVTVTAMMSRILT